MDSVRRNRTGDAYTAKILLDRSSRENRVGTRAKIGVHLQTAMTFVSLIQVSTNPAA